MPKEDLGSTLIVLDGATYDVVQGPAAGTAAVLAARLEVLQNLDLGRILIDLERTNELLYVAACGVAGAKNTTLSGKVAGLQYRLLTSCSDSLTAMVSFKESAGAVLRALSQGFRFLYRSPPQEDRTIKVLTACEKQATVMAQTAGTLAAGFKALADDAEAVLESTLNERDMEEQERLAAIKRKADLKALDEKARALKTSLAEQMEKVQKLADEARAAQAKAEDRAFGLAILGGLTSALSSGVQAFAAYKTAPLTAASTLAGAAAGAVKPPRVPSSDEFEPPPLPPRLK